jgi:hypothetical protein
MRLLRRVRSQDSYQPRTAVFVAQRAFRARRQQLVLVHRLLFELCPCPLHHVQYTTLMSTVQSDCMSA